MVQEFRNLGSDFNVEMLFCPRAEKLIFWASNGIGVNTKVVGANLTYLKKSKLEFFKIKNNPPR